MGNFAELKKGLLAPAIVEALGVAVRHEPKAGGGQADGLALSITSRPELDLEGDNWKFATGETAQWHDMPLRNDVIEIVDTGERYIVNRAVDNGGILELKLEATTK